MLPADPIIRRQASRPCRLERPQQVAHDRRIVADVERVDDVLVDLIGVGDAGVLALMLHPAFDDEAFQHPSGLGDILPHVPADRPVALAHGAEAAQGRDELRLLRGRDPVFDLDEHGAPRSGGE